MAFLTWDKQDARDFADYVDSIRAPESWRTGAGAVRLAAQSADVPTEQPEVPSGQTASAPENLAGND